MAFRTSESRIGRRFLGLRRLPAARMGMLGSLGTRAARAALIARRRAMPFVRARARSVGIKNVRTGGLLGLEVKFLDAPRTLTAIASPADATGGEMDPSSVITGCLSAPAQGDGPSNRDGNRIAMKSIYITGLISIAGQSALAALNAEVFPTVFLALVLDTQTNAAQLNSEDVFTNPNASGDTAAQPLRNMSFTNRFKVLKTLTIPGSRFFAVASNNAAATTISTTGCHLPFSLSKNLGGLKVQFTTGSTTADVAGVIDNSLHLIAYCSSTASNPTIAYNSRLRFVG